MNDNQRVYPVDYFFLHHSTGPDFKNASDIEVQDWYSTIGKARGYSNGAVNSNHEHPSRPGQQTYAMAQFTLREYTLDGNKYGWRLTDLIARPWQNVAWAVGNWFYNQRGSSVEVCGNYINRTLPDKALMCLADFLREIDKELNGALKVWLHSEVFATQCPAGIASQRDRLVDMINDPAKWNAILWPPKPVEPPKPVITTKDETSTFKLPYGIITKNDDTLPLGERKITVQGVEGTRTIVTRVTYTDGKETSRVQLSETTIDPVSERVSTGTYVKPTDPGKDEEQDVKINGIMDLLRAIGEAFARFLDKFKK